MTTAGLYIHIPYCRRACPYCDFYFSVNRASQPAFVQALVKEMQHVQMEWNGVTFTSVYLGGGTPSCLTEEELNYIFLHIFSTFSINENAEITLEVNPEDVTDATAAGWRRAGINRISLGVQALQDGHLKKLGRHHSRAQALKSIEVCMGNFNNVSVDLMYHLPELTPDEWQASVTEICNIGPAHISAYGLTVEPRTLFHTQVQRGEWAPANDDAFLAQYQILRETTDQYGYDHYEISNLGKPDFYSQHNQGYWQGSPYLGLGPRAHGYDGHRLRWVNNCTVHAYINAITAYDFSFRQTEELSEEDWVLDMALTQLRTARGVIHAEVLNKIMPLFSDLPEGWLRHNHSLSLQPERWPVLDSILLKLVS